MRTWWTEFRTTLRLAVPIILSQLIQMLFAFVDAVMVGRLGVTPLAAVGFGMLIAWIPMIAGLGLCVAVHVLTASAHSSGRRDESSEVLRHGLWLGAAYGIACGVIFHFGINLLDYVPLVDREVVALAKPFVALMVWSTLPVMLFTVVKNYCEAQNRAWLPLCILAANLGLNVLFNWVFIYGNLGVPALGVVGAATSTLIARSLSFIVLFAIVLASPELRPAWVSGLFSRLSGEWVRRVFAIGGPSSGQILFEVGVFNFATLLASMLGKVTLDGHQIALNIAALSFMVPLGVSQAAGIRVSQAVGLGKFALARRIGWSSLVGSIAFMAAYAVAVVLARHELPRIFLKAAEPDAAAVLDLAATLLIGAGAFAVFDGAQITSLGALRGLRDVRVPTVITFIGYWLVGAPLLWYLGWHKGWGGPGIWTGLFCGVFVVGVALMVRFDLISRRRLREETLRGGA